MNCLFMALILDSLLFTPVMGVGKSLDVNKTLWFTPKPCVKEHLQTFDRSKVEIGRDDTEHPVFSVLSVKKIDLP